MTLVVKNPPANVGDSGDLGLTPGLEDPPEEGIAAHPSILAWRVLGQRSLAGYSPLDHKESDMTEVT